MKRVAIVLGVFYVVQFVLTLAVWSTRQNLGSDELLASLFYVAIMTLPFLLAYIPVRKYLQRRDTFYYTWGPVAGAQWLVQGLYIAALSALELSRFRQVEEIVFALGAGTAMVTATLFLGSFILKRFKLCTPAEQNLDVFD